MLPPMDLIWGNILNIFPSDASIKQVFSVHFVPNIFMGSTLFDNILLPSYVHFCTYLLGCFPVTICITWGGYQTELILSAHCWSATQPKQLVLFIYLFFVDIPSLLPVAQYHLQIQDCWAAYLSRGSQQWTRSSPLSSQSRMSESTLTKSVINCHCKTVDYMIFPYFLLIIYTFVQYTFLLYLR